MNREQIIQMARDAEEAAKYVTPQGLEYKEEFVLRFAAAIRAATKEEDARICEKLADKENERGRVFTEEGHRISAREIRASK